MLPPSLTLLWGGQIFLLLLLSEVPVACCLLRTAWKGASTVASPGRHGQWLKFLKGSLTFRANCRAAS